LGACDFLKIGSYSLFDAFDFVTGQIFLPLGGFFTCLFIGWYVPKQIVKDEFTNWGTLRGTFFGMYYFAVKYICPLLILAIFLHQFKVF
jgi:NSS family neurotransmitter:Na+ symporter